MQIGCAIFLGASSVAGFCRASEMGSDRSIRRRGEALVKLSSSVTLVVSGYGLMMCPPRGDSASPVSPGAENVTKSYWKMRDWVLLIFIISAPGSI